MRFRAGPGMEGRPLSPAAGSGPEPASGWDYLRDFKRHTYPVGIIDGDHDSLDVGSQLIKKWVDGVAHVRLSIVERAGHLIWVDQPERFATELRRHLEGTP